MKGLLTEINGGDLLIEGGSCVVAGSEPQVIEGVLRAMRGEWREWPLLGGELTKMLHGTARLLWCQRAREACKAAGASVTRVTMNERGEIAVE
ncbi:MAG: hypothetical protein NC301_08850 [Bacteroides sp.]|nr:hypothetical protein [Bacteroides sp.]